MVIMAVAVLLRLRGLGFGLPALYDPDEPIFFLNALKLLREGTLNPGWFGHPGTTTIYSLALVDLLVLGAGLLSGRFANAGDFGRAIYADPGVVVLPGRLFILACGLATIVLTFVLARRLFGTRAGLLAAGLLAIDPVHVKYSQIIRTDMHETVFLLLSVLAAVNVVRRGRLSDYVWAAVWLGLAVATKWPAATVFVSLVGACACRAWRMPGRRGAELARFALAGMTALAALILASPFLVLDFHTAVANVSGEAKTHHPGAAGHGFLANAWWYLAHAFRGALGLTGMAGAAIGFVLGVRRSTAFEATLVPFVLVSFVAISVQGLVWERWIVPILPFVTIALAAALEVLAERLDGRWGKATWRVAVAGVAVPLLISGEAAARERANDTRAAASTWARAHIPPGRTVIVEQLAFDLLGTGWRFLYPVGNAGCVDVAANLRARIPYSTVERWRGGRTVVDIGTIDPATFATCRADWAIIVDYDRYRLEPDAYAAEVRTYQALIAQGGIAATFHPTPGRMGGPIVRIVRLDPRSPGWSTVAVSFQRQGRDSMTR